MSIHAFLRPSLPSATVCPHQGRWLVRVGNEVRRTFSGTDAMRRATALALTLNDPTLARLVAGFLKVCPALWKTAYRASDLVLHHHLTAPLRPGGKPRRHGHELARVRSSTRSDTYYTLRQDADGMLTCTCPSFCEHPLYGPAGKPFCKHLLAYVFQQHLARPLPAPPTPKELWEALSAKLQAHLQPATWHKLFAEARLSPRSTVTQLCIYVSDKAVATLLKQPQWQDVLHRLLTSLCGYRLRIRITVPRTRKIHPAPPLTVFPAVQPGGVQAA
jgi:hypothetical protein